MRGFGDAGADAAARDAADALRCLSAEFLHPHDDRGRRLIYLCGHSLGLQPRSAARYLAEELEDWHRLAVRGHHLGRRPWIGYHERVAASLAVLVGAEQSEVVAMNSLTVNLHLMMVSFFRPAGKRDKILIEKSAFPSDRYAVVSQLEFHGLDPARHLIEVAPREGERTLRTAELVRRIEEEASSLALVLLPSVQYLSGECLDSGAVSAAARRAGAAVGLDLAHAIGNVPLQLHDWGVDFAVWCSYKYLNAGPGAIGGCFVHERHARRFDLPRFAGWWGHDPERRFLMGPQLELSEGAQGWQISNPPIFAIAPLLASLEIFDRAGIRRLREKSVALTGYLQTLIDSRLAGALELVTPRDPRARGAQLSLRIDRPAAAAKRCFERLTERGIIGDWREPDVLRLSPMPLYTSYADVSTAVDALADALRA